MRGKWSAINLLSITLNSLDDDDCVRLYDEAYGSDKIKLNGFCYTAVQYTQWNCRSMTGNLHPPKCDCVCVYHLSWAENVISVQNGSWTKNPFFVFYYYHYYVCFHWNQYIICCCCSFLHVLSYLLNKLSGNRWHSCMRQWNQNIKCMLSKVHHLIKFSIQLFHSQWNT